MAVRRRSRWLTRIGALLVSIPASAIAASFTPLGDLPGGDFDSQARAISSDGSTVLGVGYGPVNIGKSFVWNAAEGMRTLDQLDPALANAGATRLSADGSHITGVIRIPNPTMFHAEAFLWDARSGLRLLGDLPGGRIDSSGRFMSDDGTVIAGWGDSGFGTEAFVWDDTNGIRGLGRLPLSQSSSLAYGISADGSTIVGASFVDGVSQAVVWDELHGLRTIGDLPTGEIFSVATAASADGSLVFGSSATTFGSEAFVWDAVRGMRRLGEGVGRPVSRFVNAVSDDGTIVVGRDWSVRLGDQAVIWDAAGTMQPLSTLLRSLGIDLTGWKLSEAMDVSADGRTIVGYGTNPSGKREAWIAVIPEPGSVPLIAFGLALLASRRPRSNLR